MSSEKSLVLPSSSSLEGRCDGRTLAMVLDSEMKNHMLRKVRAMNWQVPESLMACVALPALVHLHLDIFCEKKNIHALFKHYILSFVIVYDPA